MNTLIVSTFDCSFEYFDKFVADFHEKEGFILPSLDRLSIRYFFIAAGDFVLNKYVFGSDYKDQFLLYLH